MYANDNDNILFNHNVQIEITTFNSLENQVINLSGDYYYDKSVCHYHNSYFNKVLSILILLLLQCHGQKTKYRINVQKEVKEWPTINIHYTV